MDWIDVSTLKLLAVTIWLAIFSMIVPEGIIGTLAALASVTTIAFNLYRFYETRKQKYNDRDHS